MADGVLLCVYPFLFVFSGCASRMGNHLLVIFRSILCQLRSSQLSLVHRFCRVLEDPRDRLEPAVECQRGWSAKGQPAAVCLGQGDPGPDHRRNRARILHAKAASAPVVAYPLCYGCRCSARQLDRRHLCPGSFHLGSLRGPAQGVSGVSSDCAVFSLAADNHLEADGHCHSTDGV